MNILIAQIMQFGVMALPSIPLLFVDNVILNIVIWIIWILWMIFLATGESFSHNCFTHMLVLIPIMIVYKLGLMHGGWLIACVAWVLLGEIYVNIMTRVWGNIIANAPSPHSPWNKIEDKEQ